MAPKNPWPAQIHDVKRAVAWVKEHIADGSILRFLRDRAGEDIDLSVHKDGGPYGNFERFYVSYLQAIQDAYGGQGRRKWGVENRGLCLLVAWTAQILQDGADWRPNLNTAGVEPA